MDQEKQWQRRKLVFLGLAAWSFGCVSTQTPASVALPETARVDSSESAATTSDVTAPSSHRAVVTGVDLSKTIGEVGIPFRGQLIARASRIAHPQYAIAPLPPGLRFNENTGTLSGVPTKAGFYRLTVAVRERPPGATWHIPQASDRWWTDNTELAIYEAIHD
jgi:hypothetical protein